MDSIHFMIFGNCWAPIFGYFQNRGKSDVLCHFSSCILHCSWISLLVKPLVGHLAHTLHNLPFFSRFLLTNRRAVWNFVCRAANWSQLRIHSTTFKTTSICCFERLSHSYLEVWLELQLEKKFHPLLQKQASLFN